MATANITTSNKLLFVSIDIGTTYSGYAYSFKPENERDKWKIFTKHWKPDGQEKTPTVLLLDSNQEFLSFGFDAENEYAQLADDNAHHGYYYFHHFKMALHDNDNLRRNEEIEDEQGKHLLASKVFMHSIRYLKEMVEKDLKGRGINIKDDEITWILTVPAIWNDAAKQFMREASLQAGIKNEDLTLALEPEAASIYCKEMIINREDKPVGTELTALPEGTKFMVIDMGGGTVDVTVRQVVEGRKLKELNLATGGAWGGSKVNENFMVFMKQLLGNDVWNNFCSDFRADKLEIEREFEKKKRYIDLTTSNQILIRLPSTLRDVFKEFKRKEMTNSVAIEAGFQGTIDIKRDKMTLDANLVKSFFKDSLESIVNHVKGLLKDTDAEALFLVGGFAESPLVCETFLQTFPGKRIVSYTDARLCVLKGAVLYGHDPKIVTARICKHSYGTQAMRYFIEGHDPEDQKIIVDGKPFCKVFVKHAEIGQTVFIDDRSTHEMEALTARMTAMTIPVYVSKMKNPTYTSDHSCRQLGKMTVNMSDTTGGLDRKVIVSMTFGESELDVECVNSQSGEKISASFDFLGQM